MSTPLSDITKKVQNNKSKSSLTEDNDKWEQFLVLAPNVPGDDHEYDEAKDNPWLDEDLLEKGHQFAHDYIFGLAIAHTFVLLHGFSLRPLAGAMLRTGEFVGYEKAAQRFLETVIHVLRWYHYKIKDKNHVGFRDICKVRGIHERNRKQLEKNRDKEPNIPPPSRQMKRDCEDYKSIMEIELRPLDNKVYGEMDNLTFKPPVFMSQFDVVLTQMSFIFPVYLFPRAYGINAKGIKSLDGFIHLWALIGDMLGIKDEFNMAIDPKKKYYQRMLKEIALPSLRDVNPNSMLLQASLDKGLRKMVFLFRIKGSIYYFLKETGIEEFQDKFMWSCLDWSDKLFYYLLKITVFFYRNFWIVRKILNFITVTFALSAYKIIVPDA